VATAHGCLDLAGGTRRGDVSDGGAPNLGRKWSPGEPAGSQDPWQTGVGTTDTEHRTNNAKDRAIDANAYRERDSNRGASGARTLA